MTASLCEIVHTPLFLLCDSCLADDGVLGLVACESVSSSYVLDPSWRRLGAGETGVVVGEGKSQSLSTMKLSVNSTSVAR
jgi:hypothetical protein